MLATAPRSPSSPLGRLWAARWLMSREGFDGLRCASRPLCAHSHPPTLRSLALVPIVRRAVDGRRSLSRARDATLIPVRPGPESEAPFAFSFTEHAAAYVRQGRMHDLFKLAARASAEGIVDPDGAAGDGERAVLRAALQYCARHGLWRQAEAVVSLVARSSNPVPLEMHHLMLEACAQAGEWQRAEMALMRMQRIDGVAPSAECFATVIRACGRAGRLPSALHHMRACVLMQHQQGHADGEGVRRGRRNDGNKSRQTPASSEGGIGWHRARHWATGALAQHTTPSESGAQDPATATSTRRPPTPLYVVLLAAIDACASCASTTDADALFSQAREAGLVDAPMFAALLSAYEAAGHVDACLRTYTSMLREGIRPHARAYATMVRACRRGSRAAQAVALCRDAARVGVLDTDMVEGALLTCAEHAGEVPAPALAAFIRDVVAPAPQLCTAQVLVRAADALLASKRPATLVSGRTPDPSTSGIGGFEQSTVRRRRGSQPPCLPTAFEHGDAATAHSALGELLDLSSDPLTDGSLSPELLCRIAQSCAEQCDVDMARRVMATRRALAERGAAGMRGPQPPTPAHSFSSWRGVGAGQHPSTAAIPSMLTSAGPDRRHSAAVTTNSASSGMPLPIASTTADRADATTLAHLLRAFSLRGELGSVLSILESARAEHRASPALCDEARALLQREKQARSAARTESVSATAAADALVARLAQAVERVCGTESSVIDSPHWVVESCT